MYFEINIFPKSDTLVKTVFTYLLTVSFLMNVGGKMVIYVDFLINQEYIAKNLCENKDKPMLQCNGKCQLVKELAKEEKKEKKEDKQKFEDNTTYFFCSFEPLVVSNTVFIEKREHTCATVQSRRAGHVTKVFHPPTLC